MRVHQASIGKRNKDVSTESQEVKNLEISLNNCISMPTLIGVILERTERTNHVIVHFVDVIENVK